MSLLSVASLGTSPALANDGPILPQSPHTDFSICQQGDQAEQAKNKCDDSQKKAAQACAPVSGDAAALTSSAPSTNGAAGDAAKGNSKSSDVAKAFAARCCPAAQKCQADCGDYKSKAPSSCQKAKQQPQDPMAPPIGQAGAQEASGILANVCAQAQSRCAKAQQQAAANDGTEKSDKDQAKKNADNGGGMPQLPQIPQSQSGGGSSPSASASNAEDNCTTNPTGQACLCASNPRGCTEAQLAAQASLGAASAGGDQGGGDSGGGSSPNAENPMSALGESSGSAGAAGSGAGGGGMMGGGGGGANAGAGKADSSGDKKKSLLSGGVYGGADGGGGGAGGGGYDDEGDKSKKGAAGKPFALAASRGAAIQGLTKSGGRTNWEKVKLRYSDNTGTFLKDEKDFFCMGASCKKPNEPQPAALAAAASATSGPPAKPAAKTTAVSAPAGDRKPAASPPARPTGK